MGERFGQWPGDIERRSAPEVLRWVAILGAESGARNDLYGLPHDDPNELLTRFR